MTGRLDEGRPSVISNPGVVPMDPMAIALDDILDDPSPCECEFTPDPDDPEESVNYLRRCKACGRTSWSLHCPHDGIQGTCSCGERLPQVKTEG